MSAPAPKLAPVVRISEFARRTERKYLSTYRLLLGMHAKDLEERPEVAGWLARLGGVYVVNLSMLRVAHPALFERKYVRREEHEELAERVAKIEGDVRQLRIVQNSQGARLRRVEASS